MELDDFKQNAYISNKKKTKQRINGLCDRGVGILLFAKPTVFFCSFPRCFFYQLLMKIGIKINDIVKVKFNRFLFLSLT